MSEQTKPQAKPATKLATHVSVIIRADVRPGLQACGGYAVGRPHTVPVLEAARLVRDKGFAFCLPGDKAACEEACAAIAVAEAKAKAEAEAAATTTKSEG